MYLGQYQNSLIEANLKTFKTELDLAALALSDSRGPADTKATAERLGAALGHRIYVFDKSKLKLEIRQSFENQKDVDEKGFDSIETLKDLARFLFAFLPARDALKPYPAPNGTDPFIYPDVPEAFLGKSNIDAWRGDDGVILLSAAAPIMGADGKPAGALLMVQEADNIQREVGHVWFQTFMIFFSTLIITIFLSIYLAGTIGHPLRRLARAAEFVRHGKSRDVEIPDLSYRMDEIGELSIVLRDMTKALWERMDSIESFAADVAHELKNPLTSLRSAVETLPIAKKESDRARLAEIIKDDVLRMDRLITDISTASRLDAELARQSLVPVDLHAVIADVLNIRRQADFKKTGIEYDLHWPIDDEAPVLVRGLEGRIAQVFENLISNAESFTPPGGHIKILAKIFPKAVQVTVDDDGPGIPENRLEKIFERFYTERPAHETYGRHSGLGLSICRQIVTALGGKIFADNRMDENGKIAGARFTVVLVRDA